MSIMTINKKYPFKKYLLLSAVMLLPFVLFLLDVGYALFDFPEFPLIMAYLLIVPPIPFLFLSFLHELRVRKKTVPVNLSLYTAYTFMAVTIIFGILTSYPEIARDRPFTGFDLIAYIFSPIVHSIPMVVGYFLGWAIEAVCKMARAIVNNGAVMVMSMKSSILKRATVLLIIYFACSISATGYCWSYGLEFSDLVSTWLWLHLGLIMLVEYISSPLIGLVLVCTNILCMLAYLVRPNIVTSIVSFLGIVIWFFGGVLGMLMGI